MKFVFHTFMARVTCFLLGHKWKRESNLVVCRAESTKYGIVFMPDHYRMYCPFCGATKKEPYVEPL